MTEVKLAAIKLISGEEIICYVLDIIDSDHYSTILIRDPLKVEYVDGRRKTKKNYKLTPWFLFSSTREHEIDLGKIMGISKIDDTDLRADYTRYFHHILASSIEETKPDTEGYLGSVEGSRELLEKLYKDIDSNERPSDIQ